MGYDHYYGKHWARTSGWLPVSIEFKERVEKEKIKYLTLCDVQAIDIFMLEQAAVLTRNDNRFLTDIIICEADNEKIPEIFEVTKPPLREAIVQGKLEKLLLFEDDDETRDVDPDEDVRNRKLREKLAIKKHAQKLKKEFPFDIINFDPYGNLLSPNRELFRAFEEIFKLQHGLGQFLMFVTSPINDFDEILPQFKADFDKNIADHEEIKVCSETYLQTSDFSEFSKHKKAAIGLGKSMVAKYSKKYGWESKHHGIYVYENDAGRFMMSSVIEFTANSDANKEDWYINDVKAIIENMPVSISFQAANTDKEIIDSLESIIEYRKQLQKEFSN